MNNVSCPNCGNNGQAANFNELLDLPIEFDDDGEPIENMGGNSDQFAFRNRGQIEGYPIWVCNKCEKAGVWMKTGFFGKPKPITGEGFDALKTDWESRTGSKF